MKLQEYLNALNTLVKQNPSIVEAEVYTMSDDEGNERNSVNFLPTVKSLNSDGDLVKPVEGEDATLIVILN